MRYFLSISKEEIFRYRDHPLPSVQIAIAIRDSSIRDLSIIDFLFLSSNYIKKVEFMKKFDYIE